MRAGAPEWGSGADTLCSFGYSFIYHGAGVPDSYTLESGAVIVLNNTPFFFKETRE